jgi:peptidoglycan-associated lipoprotein
MRRAAIVMMMLAASACSQSRPETAAMPAPDSAAVRARQEAELARARADSIRRADSLAATERTRAERVRAEVAAESLATARSATGLPAADSATLYGLIHFEFNSTRIEEHFEDELEAKLRILQRYPRLELRIGGHCDDRGADEYNLALGQRRAAAVKRWLVDRGIDASRIEIVSYGEERPIVSGEDESAMAMNRRADFMVTDN